MYLSKVELDTKKRETSRALYDRGKLHSILEDCFPGERQHPLWRLEANQGSYSLIILSNDKPDFESLYLRIGRGIGKTIDYTPFLTMVCDEGRILNYLISFNPVICKNGSRIPLNLKRTTNRNYCAEDWLKDRLEKNGAKVLEAFSKDSGTVRIKEGKGRIFIATYQGRLVITDPARFRNVLENGLGHAKAFGCGLISVLP